MKQKFKILVFPCGSEIGLEIYRSLKYSSHIELFGANSIDDHGRFIYENYIGGVPFINDEDLIPYLTNLVSELKIDAIYPAMDKVIWKLKANEGRLGCKVLASEDYTTEICLSKRKTYKIFKEIIRVPKFYETIENIDSYPIFIKPNIGYGSRGIFKAENESELNCFFQFKTISDYVITEYLPGEEYTIDCFTDRFGNLRFVGPRVRKRINNGISVSTRPIIDNQHDFESIAFKINQTIKLKDRKSTRLNSSHTDISRMPSSA